MKTFLLIILMLGIRYSVSTVVAQSTSTDNQVIQTSTDDIKSIIKPTTTAAELDSLKAYLELMGVKLSILKIERKPDGFIQYISLQVSSADGVVAYHASKFTEIVIERNEDVKIGVRGGVAAELK